MASPSEGVADNEIAMNSQQRKCGSFTLNQPLPVSIFTPTADVALNSITITIDLFVKKVGSQLTIENDELATAFKSQFGGQVFCARQQLAMDFNGTKLDLAVESFEHAAIDMLNGSAAKSQPAAIELGQVLRSTTILWKKCPGTQTNIIIVGGAGPARNDSLFKKDFNFEAMGIGGLDEQFKKMFRTAFASRIFPGIVKQLGINHIRGILLYGPPGCG